MGLEVRGGGYRFNLYGADVGDFLGRLSTALTAGLLVAGDVGTRAAHGEIYAQEARSQKISDTEEYKNSLTDEQKEKLKDAAEIAREALLNPKCAKFIAGNSGYDPAKILEGLLKGGNFFHGGIPGNVATTYGGYGSPSLAYIGLRNLFFDDKAKVGGWAGILFAGMKLDLREARAETILHELFHAIQPYVAHPTGVKKDDEALSKAGYTLKTKEYFNRNIRTKCLAPLRKKAK